MFNEAVMRDRAEKMERKLHEAVVEGNIISLLQLLHEDKLVLDRFVVGCFPETPLHIAALLGHFEFAKKILNIRPELARELNFRNSSPLHLAAAKGYVEIVKVLLIASPDMCFAQDWEGRNPLHVAVIKGRFEVLKELVRTRPQAARALVDGGGTILHLCVKYNQLEALKLLVVTIDDREFANRKDYDGFNILHLAVAYKQIDIINFFITSTALETKALNANGFTAFDMLSQVKDMEIGESLRHGGGLRSKDDGAIRSRNFSPSSEANNQVKMLRSRKKSWKKKKHRNKYHDWVEQKRNTLMVVASLIATMAFQAGTNPPDFDFDSNSENKNYVGWFILFNSLGFVASLSIILLLISDLPLKNRVFVWILMVIMSATIMSMACAYSISVQLWAPTDVEFRPNILLTKCIFGWVVIIVFGHVIRLLLKLAKYVMPKQRESRIYPDLAI